MTPKDQAPATLIPTFEHGTVLDNPKAIRFYQLLVWRAGLRLECLGMRKSGRQISVIVRNALGFTGNKKEVLRKLELYIEKERARALV